MTGIVNTKRLIGIASLAAAAAFALPAGSAHAADCDVYAAPGGGDANPGSQAAPVQTAQELVDRLEPGQTGCLASGTYDSDWQVKVATPNVTLTSSPGERATLRARLWIAKEANGATVRDLDLDGRNDKELPSPTINGDDVTFTGNDVTNHHTAICFILGSSEGYGVADRTLIEDNDIHDCGVLPAENHDHGIYVSVARDAVIRGNRIYDNADRGVQLYKDAQRTLVTGNIIDGNGQGVIFGGSADYASSGNRVVGNVITNSKVRHNIESHWEGPVGSDNLASNNCIGGGVEDDGDGGLKLSNGGFEAADNIIAKPEFVDRASGDLTLAPGSTCAEVLAGETPTESPSGGGSKKGGNGSKKGGNGSKASGGRPQAKRIKAKLSRKKVRRGRTVKVKGRAFGARKVKILTKTRGRQGWKRIGRAATRGGNRFAARIKVRGKGRIKFKVAARGHRDSRKLRLRVA